MKLNYLGGKQMMKDNMSYELMIDIVVNIVKKYMHENNKVKEGGASNE